MGPNKFDGPCRGCGKTVRAGTGFFERYKGKWYCRHRECTKKSVATSKGVDMDTDNMWVWSCGVNHEPLLVDQKYQPILCPCGKPTVKYKDYVASQAKDQV